MEKELFIKSRFNNHELIKYGFILKDNNYIYETYILDNFKLIIQIRFNDIKTQVIDLDINEEYTNHLLLNPGQFALKIKNKCLDVLNDIKDKCTITLYFKYNQANRITSLIYQKYQIEPEFIFKNPSSAGVFRNKNNKKWFGIIMNINKKILDNENKDIEIINVKLDKNKIIDLLNNDGFYKAYHMNKIHWITIVLDETISDDMIMKLIDESYSYHI